MPGLDPPEDRTLTTLYVGDLGDTSTETDLRNHFYQFGETQTSTIAQRQQCTFIQVATGQAAEGAANGPRLNVKRGRSQATRGQEKRRMDPQTLG